MLAQIVPFSFGWGPGGGPSVFISSKIPLGLYDAFVQNDTYGGCIGVRDDDSLFLLLLCVAVIDGQGRRAAA